MSRDSLNAQRFDDIFPTLSEKGYVVRAASPGLVFRPAWHGKDSLGDRDQSESRAHDGSELADEDVQTWRQWQRTAVCEQ